MNEVIKQIKKNRVNIKAWDVRHRLTSDRQGIISYDHYLKFLGSWGCCFYILCTVLGSGCPQIAKATIPTRHRVEGGRTNAETFAARLDLISKNL